jgi:hypothetical protein
MYYLVYKSSARQSLTHLQLVEILQSSHRNNSLLGVTGMLLYCQGKFLQVLEGERDIVHNLFLKIVKNPLHTDASVLLEGGISHRNFESWVMGYKSLDDAELLSLSGFKNIDYFFDTTSINDDSHPALIFLKLFFKRNQSDHLQYL